MSIFGGIFHAGSGKVKTDFWHLLQGEYANALDQLTVLEKEQLVCWALDKSRILEETHDGLIREANGGRYTLAGHFRLDYKDILADKLGIRHAELEKISDLELVVRAFCKWKFKCVLHLEGDWAFVVQDKLDKSIWLFRDPVGCSALFYCVLENQLIFSSDSRVFSRLPVNWKLDPEQFFKLGLDIGKLDDGKTVLKELNILKKGHTIRYNGSIEVVSTRELPPQGIPVRFKDFGDHVAWFKSVYAAAVRSRIGKGDAGLLLSAGLDSSMLCYFLARELAMQSRKFNTFTSFPRFIGLYPEDRQQKIREDIPVKQFLAPFKRVEAYYLDFEDKDVAETFGEEPFPVVNVLVKPNTFWVQGIYQFARDKGVKHVFAAKMSNYTTSWDAPYIALHLLFNRRFLPLFKHLSAIAQGDWISWLKAFKHELILPIRHELRLFFKRRQYWIGGWNVVPGLVQPDKMEIKKFDRWDFRRQFVPGYSSNSNPKLLRYKIINSNLDHLGVQGYLDGIHYDMEILDPTGDLRVINCSLGMPEEIFYRIGERKHLYRQIMKGLLTEEVLGKKIPYPQAYDIGLRLMDSQIIERSFHAKKDGKVNTPLLRDSAVLAAYASIRKWAMLPQGLAKSATILRFFSLKHLLGRFHLPIKNTNFIE
jgi:asparagine synthase (glutamine-hydrolysing)